ncbi:hypothetical protein PS15m_000712 [Mucor circinelloides]
MSSLKWEDALKGTITVVQSLSSGSPVSALKHAAYKFMNVLANALMIHTNKLAGDWNEVEYTFFFIYPILKRALYDVPFRFKLGEPHFQCAVKHINDDEAADSGPKIDAVMYHKSLGLAKSPVEVSGPNYKINKNYCIGDRVKLARNLKSILKAIEKCTKTPDTITLQIKVYGIQVYQDRLLIYSLSRVTATYCDFLCEKSMDIPVSPGLFNKEALFFVTFFLTCLIFTTT